MAFDLSALGNKLKRCREHLKLDIDEVSESTGIITSSLVEYEEGRKEPSGDEILILSDYYQQDYRFFISNQQKTASDEIDILYRKFGSEFTKEDRRTIQEFIFLCECEESIMNALEMTKVSFNYTPRGTFYKGHGEDAAKALRKQIGYKDTELYQNIYDEFRKIGLHIFRRRLNNSSFSGLFINHPWAGKCILVNYDEDIYRQNFTLAHEVGHSIFDIKEQVNISFTNSERWKNTDLKEIRANNFASNFLVPKEVVRSLNVNNWTPEIVIKISDQLMVNIETLLIALKEYSIIDDKVYQNLKRTKIPSHSKRDFELTGLEGKRLEAKKTLLERGLSSSYVKNISEAYSQGLISAKRMAEMFLSDEFELPYILQTFNSQVNYGS